MVRSCRRTLASLPPCGQFRREVVAYDLVRRCGYRLRMKGPMDHLNPANLASLQPHLDATRVKRGFGKEVLDNSSSQFSRRLILFEYNGNVRPRRHVCSVPSVHASVSSVVHYQPHCTSCALEFSMSPRAPLFARSHAQRKCVNSSSRRSAPGSLSVESMTEARRHGCGRPDYAK